MSLGSPDVVERLAAACQIVAGQAIAWCEPPEADALLPYFGDCPTADSQAEAITVRSVIAEFVRRLGHSVHDGFHRRYRAAHCGLRLPMIESPTHEPIEINVGAFVHDWLEGYRRQFDAAHASPAQQARKHLERHFTTNVTSADLAGLIGIERRTLDRQFRGEIGMTVTDYCTRLRVIEAIRQLRAGHKADAIALDVGWRARKDLYRAVRTIAGVLPAQIHSLSNERMDEILDRIQARSALTACDN